MNNLGNIVTSIVVIAMVMMIAILAHQIAYADEVTIETTFPIVNHSCIESNNGLFPFAECYIQGDDFFIGGDGLSYSWDSVEEKYVPTEQLIEEAKALYEEKEAREKQPEPTQAEKAIAGYERDEITQLEKQLISLLEKQRSVCLIDILTIQKYGELEIPVEKFIDADGNISLQLVRAHIDTAFSQRNHPAIGELLKDIEACRGQEALSYITGPRYDHMVVDDEFTPRFDHRDIATGMTPFKTQQLTERDFFKANYAADNVMCTGTQFSKSVQRDYNCFPYVDYHLSGAAVMYQSDAMDRYERYLENGDDEQLTKLRQDALQDKIRETLR